MKRIKINESTADKVEDFYLMWVAFQIFPCGVVTGYLLATIFFG